MSYAKEFLAIFLAFKKFGHILWGTPKPITILTDNKLVTRFFQTKIIPPALWNAQDYVIQFNFVIAYIPGKNNTAAYYLSRMEKDPKEKLVLTIRAEVEKRPIEVNVQSAGVSEEEQIFFTEEDDETEAQSWERKKQSRNNYQNTEAVIHNNAISENVVDKITNFSQRLHRTPIKPYPNIPWIQLYNNSKPKSKMRKFQKTYYCSIIAINTISIP